MKETGLMFKAPLVRAILEGRKTQTRRVVKGVGHDNCIALRKPSKTKAGVFTHAMDAPKLKLCPYGQPGDRLWVREAWRACRDLDGVPPRDIPPGSSIEHEATKRSYAEIGLTGKLRPSMFMPRWASRIWLEVTGVRVERLQDISESDAQAEGCSIECMTPTGDDSGSAIYGPGGFAALWGSTTGRPALPANTNSKRYARVKHWLDTHPDTNGWDANPWVWAIDFKVLSTTGRPA